MSALPLVMVALPMLTALGLLALLQVRGRGPHHAAPSTLKWLRRLGLGSLLAQLGVAVALLGYSAGDEILVHRLGNWPAPYAIVLVADRLGAIMVALTAVLALFVHLAAVDGLDRRSPSFHPLLHFQVMGLHGVFLTGDLFNLFVFFEVLLIASYSLLLCGGGPMQLRVAFRYVVLSLVGSALFLVAVSILYGVLGTLNFAHLARAAAEVDPADAPLLRGGGGLLLVVFGLKAALVPLHLWLPATYRAAPAPVQALFSIMTKVGVYAIIRIFIPIFGPDQGLAAGVAEPWLLPLGLLTLGVATLGVLASTELAQAVAFLIVASVGTMLTAVGLFDVAALAAAIYYLVHSTVLMAGFFLLAEIIAHHRGALGGRLVAGPLAGQGRSLALLFLVAAAAAAGVPPLSGFIGKVMVLAAVPPALRPWVWGVVLVTSVLTLVQLARAGSVLFWRPASDPPPPAAVPSRHRSLVPAAGLLLLSVLLGVFAGPAHELAHAASVQLFDRQRYQARVLGDAEPTPKTVVHPRDAAEAHP